MAEILRHRKAEVPNVTMKVSHEFGDSALRMAGRLTLEVPETIRMDLLKKKILLAAREDVLGVEEVEITVKHDGCDIELEDEHIARDCPYDDNGHCAVTAQRRRPQKQESASSRATAAVNNHGEHILPLINNNDRYQ